MAGECAQPAQPAAYRLVAADELGVLKVVEIPAGRKWDAAAVVSQWGAADKSNGIHSLACSATSMESGTPALLAVGRKAGRVDVLDAHTGTQHCSLTAGAPAGKAKPAATSTVVAVQFIPATDSRRLQLVVGTSEGMVSICTLSSSAQDTHEAPGASNSNSWVIRSSFSTGANLSCLAVDSAGSHIVVGGEGMQPSIWDLSTATKVWQGKGGKPNRVGLVDKPYVTAVAFLPDSTSTPAAGAAGGDAGGSGSSQEGGGISRRFVSGSASAKLHVYDTAAGRRPQQEAVFGEARITALAVEPEGKRVWAANGTGHMQLLVLQSNKLMDALKGAGGSVRTLKLYPGPEPLVASVGLDRFLRIHDISSRAGCARVYLKQQLTSVAWLPVQQPPASAPTAAAAAATAAGDNAQAAAESSKKSKHKSRKHGEAAERTASKKHSSKRRKQES